MSDVTDDHGQVTGSVTEAAATDDQLPTISGDAEANATVNVYDGDTLLGTTTANASGKWTFTPTANLADGAHSITAKAVDAAGNESEASAVRTFTVDTVAPVFTSGTSANVDENGTGTAYAPTQPTISAR